MIPAVHALLAVVNVWNEAQLATEEALAYIAIEQQEDAEYCYKQIMDVRKWILAQANEIISFSLSGGILNEANDEKFAKWEEVTDKLCHKYYTILDMISFHEAHPELSEEITEAMNRAKDPTTDEIPALI